MSKRKPELEEPYVFTSFHTRKTRRSKKTKLEELILLSNPRSVVAEQFRSIRTSLDFIAETAPVQVLIITGSDQNSGKTLVASNLALALAQGGKKTLLIDGDTRNPSIQRYFYFPKNKGLSTIKRVSQLETASYVTHHENLTILPAGNMMVNPVDFFRSKQMHLIMKEVRNTYDQIIIDTPPVLAVSDANVLSTYADGILLVLRSGKTKMQNAKKAMRILEQSSTPILGSILNDVKVTQSDYYYH